MGPPTQYHQAENEVIEVGADEDYESSCAASSFKSDTTSLASTVFHYEYENGRRYHNFRSGKYLLPNDEVEQDRLDMMHHIWLLLYGGKLHIAPLPEKGPKRVIDLGTGTGLWAIEFGDMYPDAQVIGTDLSPIQPDWVPLNVRFEVDDIEDAWTFPKNHFDYIHIRNLLGGVKDWAKLFERAYDHLEPNGYIEIQEADLSGFYSDDNSLTPSSAGNTYIRQLVLASTKLGARMDLFPELPSLLKSSGFTEVTLTRQKVPNGAWPKDKRLKEIGKWILEVTRTGAEAYALQLFIKVLGMAEEDARKLIEEFVKVTEDRNVHMYGYYGIITAKKPAAC